MSKKSKFDAQAREAENAVISAILNDPDGNAFSECAGLPESAFLDPDCRAIWRALLDGAPVADPLAIANHAKIPLTTIFSISERDRSGAFLKSNVGLVWQALRARQIKTLAGRMVEADEPAFARWREELEALEAGSDVGNPIVAELRRRLFVAEQEVVEPRIAYRVGKTPVCTAGNLTNIIAQAKAGKSAVVGAMLAAAFTLSENRDCLGFSAKNERAMALLHFDTEQSIGDWRRLIRRAMKRAEVHEHPKWFLSYSLTGMNPNECRSAVELAMIEARKKFGGIFGVIIDGVADLVIDPNDPEECFPLVTRLHALAIKHDCPVINVIHLNPGSEKTRGHLGSQLERKAESNLTLEKEKDGSTVLYSLKQRGATISKDDGPRFKWSDQDGMHMSLSSLLDARGEEERYALTEIARDVYASVENKRMRYSELIEAIKSTAKCSERTAADRARKMRQFRIIKEVPPRLLELAARSYLTAEYCKLQNTAKMTAMHPTTATLQAALYIGPRCSSSLQLKETNRKRVLFVKIIIFTNTCKNEGYRKGISSTVSPVQGPKEGISSL